MKINKYQQGSGIIPITYNILQRSVPPIGGTAASGDLELAEEELIDKDLVKDISAHALPSDVLYFLDKSNVFSSGLVISDPFSSTSSLAKYKELIMYMNQMRHNKEEFDAAYKNAVLISAMSEVAATSLGTYFALKDGKLQLITLDQITGTELLLTVRDLFNFRANSPDGAFNNYLDSILPELTSMEEVKSIIDANLLSLGESTDKNSYIYNPKTGQVNSPEMQNTLLPLLASININPLDLAGISPGHLLEIKTDNSSNSQLILKAVTSIYSQLPGNMRALINLRAKEMSIMMEKEVSPISLILEYCSSRLKNQTSVGLDIMNTATGLRGSNRTDAASDERRLTPMMNYQSGALKNPEIISLSPGSSGRMVVEADNYGQAVDSDGKPVPVGSLALFMSAGFGNITTMGQGIYIGNQRIDPSQYGEVLYNQGSVHRMWLPYAVDRMGTKHPNFELFDAFVELDKNIRANPDKRLELITTHPIFKDYVDANGQWRADRMMPFLTVDVYATGESHWIGDGYDGVINPDKTGDFIVEVSRLGIDEDTIKTAMTTGLGTKDVPYEAEGDVFKGVAFLPLVDQTGLAGIVSGEYPTMTSLNITDPRQLSVGDYRYMNYMQELNRAALGFNSANSSKLY